MSFTESLVGENSGAHQPIAGLTGDVLAGQWVNSSAGQEFTRDLTARRAAEAAEEAQGLMFGPNTVAADEALLRAARLQQAARSVGATGLQ